MKAVQVPGAGADFEILERESDHEGRPFPGITYPRVPRHEVAGVIDELGSGVTEWQKGQRVGTGWHGGQDGACLACRRGDFMNCANGKVCEISYDGGYLPAGAVSK
jgi:D-arabinose 1-dehydrogenase-like Zn-dependent alcohol dehydrogenase